MITPNKKKEKSRTYWSENYELNEKETEIIFWNNIFFNVIVASCTSQQTIKSEIPISDH